MQRFLFLPQVCVCCCVVVYVSLCICVRLFSVIHYASAYSPSHHEPRLLLFRSVLPNHRQPFISLVLPLCSRPCSVREASGVEQAASGTAPAIMHRSTYTDALFQLELDELQRMVSALCAALSLVLI